MAEPREQSIRREHDSMDDFEHLEHVQDVQSNQPKEILEGNVKKEKDMIDLSTNQVSSDPSEDSRKATLLLLEAEKNQLIPDLNTEGKSMDLEPDSFASKVENQSQGVDVKLTNQKEEKKPEPLVTEETKEDLISEAEVPVDFSKKVDDSWNVVEKAQSATKPVLGDEQNEEECSSEYMFAESPRKEHTNAVEIGESEFESEVQRSPAKNFKPVKQEVRQERVEEVEIAPKEIFRSMGIDAWFNPERLNPKVAALIYWRDPMKSGVVFGGTLAVLLSLAYFSLISVLAYLSLLVVIGTTAFRIYKTVLQAVQKTSDGHPFKEILEMDLTLPVEKVHEVADVAVAHANAAVSELRRLFLVEDFIDTMKFGVLLWCLTYVGSFFNGMTLIIIGIVALFTLPKVYETNKAQIDQNLALVRGKINVLTARVRAAIPLGKKAEVKED